MNTDGLPALETNNDERVQNPKEAELVRIIAESLCASGVPEETIGVISVYRAQLKLLNMKLKSRPGIEVLTADRSQGRDKACIIISLVRANENNMIGDLLRDWRRLNVTFTRAKCKLIIVGSRKTLDSSNVLKAFLKVLDDNGWAYKLPAGAEKLYHLPVTVSPEKRTPRKFRTNNNNNNTSYKRNAQMSPSPTKQRGGPRRKKVFKAGSSAVLASMSSLSSSSVTSPSVTKDVMAQLGAEKLALDGQRRENKWNAKEMK